MTVKKKRKKTKDIQGKKWTSYRKLWTIFKIAKGKGDNTTMVDTAKKLVKISQNLKNGKGIQIKRPTFPILEDKSK